eukprot:COSAG01_NODE_28270_length_665_cov_0.939929_1_plen_45_part_00
MGLTQADVTKLTQEHALTMQAVHDGKCSHAHTVALPTAQNRSRN